MNEALIDWRALFTTAKGRTSRAHAWIGIGILFALAVVYEAIAIGPLLLATAWLIYPMLLASATCILAKRLHDRGRSGWWAALVLLAFVMIWPTSHGASALLAAPVLFWAVIELGVMAGEPGANRFGLSPLAPVPL